MNSSRPPSSLYMCTASALLPVYPRISPNTRTSVLVLLLAVAGAAGGTSDTSQPRACACTSAVSRPTKRGEGVNGGESILMSALKERRRMRRKETVAAVQGQRGRRATRPGGIRMGA